MIIFSHRGIGFGIEENTIESFTKGLDEGFSLEVDIQKSSDDVLVVSHDTNLKRMKNIDKDLTDMTAEELKGVIPSFDEVCEIFKSHKKEGALMALHVKDEHQGDLLRLLVEAIQKHDIKDGCFIFDLTVAGAELVKQLDSTIEVSLSVGEKEYSETIHLWENVKDCKVMDIVWWDEWHSGLYNKENADLIRESGRLNYVISPELHKVHDHPKGNSLDDFKSVWKDLIEWKVDGICTDYPRELRKLIEN